MKEDCEEQAELAAWENKEERIVTFRETEGEDKMSYVYDLCESGYRIL